MGCKVHGFRLPEALVKEFEETAIKVGVTRQQAMMEAMELWLNRLSERKVK